MGQQKVQELASGLGREAIELGDPTIHVEHLKGEVAEVEQRLGMTAKDLRRNHHRGLIALSACLAGEIPRHILANEPARARAAASA